MEINWNKQARQFLKLHNWKFKDGYGFHPCYPLAEDFSVEGSIEKFCEEFYSCAWKNHKAYIKGTAILSETAETETQGATPSFNKDYQETSDNPDIIDNFKIALHNLEQLNIKSGATNG